MKNLKQFYEASVKEATAFPKFRNLKDVSKYIVDLIKSSVDDGEKEWISLKNIDPNKLFKAIKKYGKGNITDDLIVTYFNEVWDGSIWDETFQPDKYKDEDKLGRELADDIFLCIEYGGDEYQTYKDNIRN